MAIATILLCACSTKKNTPMSRQWQAFNTRYNVYFNGSEHYNEQLKMMESNYQDDYTRTLLTHPAEARADQKMPQPQGSFKRTTEKMEKAIQLHSISKKPAKRANTAKERAFRARDEFNPFLHNAWLMMGRAQYLDGDFLKAATIFLYISRHFSWLPDVVTEARLWQARCYCAEGWTYEAGNVLNLVKEKDIHGKKLTHLYNLVNADYLLRSDRSEEALPYLLHAAKTASGQQKNRLYFLLGQTYANLGKRQEAYDAFKKAGKGASLPYRAKLNARIKQSEVYNGSDIMKEIKSLRRMTMYQSNSEYLDQIYYAIGNLYLAKKDTAEAKANYLKAVESSTRSGIDKALVQLALGNIYFNERDYVKAQPCYSEAIPLIPDNYPDYQALKLRSDVLDELAVYSGNVQLQDSLLTLSKMTPEEQKKVCQDIVDRLIKAEKEAEEAARREEYLANQPAANSPMNNAPATQTFTMNTDKSWYFYNTMTRNAGKTEFQRRWGARKLEDDWRRRNKNTFALEDSSESADEDADGENPDSKDTEEEEKEVPGADDPHNVEYYLKQIPSTPEQIQTCNDIIQEGLYNEGLILKDKLMDFQAARDAFNQLDKRYPDNIYRLDSYYNLYLMAVRENNPDDAEIWRAKILSDFPDSPYAKAMADPNYFNNLRRMNDVQEELYADAYDAYLDNENAEVHTLTKAMEKDYPLSPILPKFIFIDALSYMTEGDNDEFKNRLTYLLERWPDTDMTDMASGILKGLRSGRVPHAGTENSRGMIWEMRLLANDSVPISEDGLPANFERDPEAPQYYVLAFPRDSVNANQVLYDVARFNFSSFVVKDFDLEQMSFGNVGLLIVKGFANQRQVEHYNTVLQNTDTGLPPQVHPIIISKANFELLLREGRSFEEYFRFKEESDIEETAKLENPEPESLPEYETDPESPPDDETDPESPDDGTDTGQTEEEIPEQEVKEQEDN